MEEFDFMCRPKVSWLTVNRQCNFRCPWCYGEDTHYSPKDDMSLEIAKHLVDVNAKVGVKYINLIGGEPTLWPHLSEITNYCHDYGITTCLVTNAAKFGDDKFWWQYQLNPCDEVCVSIKSAIQEQFSSITKTNLYAKTMKGVQRALDYYSCGVSTVYNSQVGMDGLRDIATMGRKMGANYFVVDLCTPVITEDGIDQGFSIEPQQLAQDIMEMQPFLDKLYEGHVEIAIYIPLCLFPASFIEMMMEKKQLTTICHVYNRSGLVFDINGDVLLCNQLFNAKTATEADYTSGNDLIAHLNSDQVCEDYRQLLRFPSGECSECRWQLDCRGGCLLTWTDSDPSICHAVA